MRRHAPAIAVVLTLSPVYAQQLQPLNPPLKNWAAPLYWAPTAAEVEQQRLEPHISHPDVSSAAVAQAASIFAAPGPMTFIAVTPCRIMDTRSSQPFSGVFGPPSLQAYGTYRQVPIPSSSCNIPSSAGAYSLNITVVPPGPLSFLTVWPAGQPYPTVSTLNAPLGGVVANAAIVVAGTNGAIQMVAGNPTDVIVDINGYYAAPTDANQNTAIGTGTLASNTSGISNTATGYQALGNNTLGGGNTADSYQALGSNSTGSYNVASGYQALFNNASGSNNIAIGYQAAVNVSGANNSNIHIGSYGFSTDNDVIRIGNPAFHTSFYAAGVSGVNVSGVPVMVNSSGQLGVVNSSQRFKEDIQDMGDSSSGLMRLRPVTFRYKQPYDDGSKPLDYGLIAEEVAEVYPDLVAYSAAGEIQTVQYQKVNAMLLNEVQKQHQQIQEQNQLAQAQQDEMSALKARLFELEKRLETLTASK